ncbi:hypothetical protein NBRC116188_18620 [Oceaniserpentilla sp. 4NH20-0058]|uniref:hypothetical protein n=1 Tax=Oceaniserpentilla sp. 4NH20-0058 TaxID=3127660 RepID=UPI0031095296
MKIAVIGTSNSVFKNNYVTALSVENEVYNLSSGRVPFYSHITTILKNSDFLESMDVVIVDHYVNDVNFYSSKLGAKYTDKLPYFYALLSRLNVPIINFFAAFYGLEEHENYDYFKLVKKLSGQFSFNILDLNEYSFDKEMYSDFIHLKREISFFIGQKLSQYLKENSLVQPSRIQGFENPFYLFYEDEFENYPELIKGRFSNSLLKLNYFELKGDVEISDHGDLLSIGYINTTKGEPLTILKINNSNFLLDGFGYYHESVPSGISGCIKLSASKLKDEAPLSLMGRKYKGNETQQTPPCLVDLLFMKNSYPDLEIPDGKANQIKLDYFNEYLHLTFPSNGHILEENEVNILKRASLDLEEINSRLSLKLMRIVKRCWPEDKIALKKMKEHRMKNKEK